MKSLTKSCLAVLLVSAMLLAPNSINSFLSIYANAADTVSVTFYGNGGTPSVSSCSFTVGQAYGDNFPSAIGNHGFSFVGWYTQPEDGEVHLRSTAARKDVTKLYAHWEENEKGVLEKNHIYKIVNVNSGLPLEPASNSKNSVVKQQTTNNNNSQLWRVTYADDDGYYKFETLNGGYALDMNASDNKFALRTPLKIYPPNNNSDAQFFSLVQGDNLSRIVYSIHSKNTGRVLDVSGSSTDAGAEVWQWCPHFGDGQLFYFEEVKERKVRFYENLNDNYLPSPQEVYQEIGTTTAPYNTCFSSRNSGVTVSLNPDRNSLIVNQLVNQTVASHDAEMTWVTTVGDSYAYGINALNDSTMQLDFVANSSVDDATIYFRWGFDGDDTIKAVPLSLGYGSYSVLLPRTRRSGHNLHPFIDKPCTVEIQNLVLCDEEAESAYAGSTDAYQLYQEKNNIREPYVYDDYIIAPDPITAREGYYFQGWYTRRVGGTKIADTDRIYCYEYEGNLTLYAQWYTFSHTHSYKYTVIPPTCEEPGYTITECNSCSLYEESDYKPALGHNYGEWQYLNDAVHQHVCSNDNSHVEKVEHSWNAGIVTLEPTTTTEGLRTYTCEVCGGSKTETIPIVNTPVITEISIQDLPLKTFYMLGEPIDLSGMVIEVSYSDGESELIASGYECEADTATTVGEQIVGVLYDGFRTEFVIWVNDVIPEDLPQLVLSSSKAAPGQTVDITVQIKNNPGIVAASLQIAYDNTRLMLMDVQDNGLLGSSSFIHGNDYSDVPFTVLWVNSLSQVNYSEDGVLVTFTFKVLEDAPIGETGITLNYSKNSTLNVELDEVAFAVSSGCIGVTKHISGDVNGDNMVDLKDVVTLRRYLSGGWAVEIDSTNADVNADKEVDLKDVIILRRYLSGGWNVTLQ